MLDRLRRWYLDRRNSCCAPDVAAAPSRRGTGEHHGDSKPEHAEAIVSRQSFRDESPETIGYETLIGLRSNLKRLDTAEDSALTVVLDLCQPFQGDLRSVIRRKHFAFRLILTSRRLPGVVSIGQLASSSAALGWNEILFEPDLFRAIAEARQSLEPGERLVVFTPRSVSDPSCPMPARAVG